jgi:hypothetical protein
MGTFHHGGTAWGAGLAPFHPTTIHRYESLWLVFRGHFDCGNYTPGSSTAFTTLGLTFRLFGFTRHAEIPLDQDSLLVVASNGCPAA